jgi:glycogen debranching enzyme
MIQPERDALLRDAQAVLDANWTGRFTVASRSLYPHQWSWDAAFIAVGRSWSEQERAQQELESLFSGQWDSGMVPHILFDPSVPPGSYFPGPDFWAADTAGGSPPGVATSGITQPPLHAAAAWEIWRHAADEATARAFLERLYPKLVAEHDYLATRRDVGGQGLASIVHPWESGLDNSPLWDPDLDDLVIPPGALPEYKRFDLVHADAADRPSDLAYDRFVYLVARYRDGGYDDSRLGEDFPFVVEAPLFNSIWCWSCHALARIARVLGEDPEPHLAMARRISAGLRDRLWDPATRRFLGWDVHGGRRLDRRTIESLMPLLDPELDDDRAGAILGELRSPHFLPDPGGQGRPDGGHERFLIPSYDLRSPDFDRRRYWRGPIWINTDWLVWRGLGQHGLTSVGPEVASSIVELVRRSGFREYFDPFTGAGYGSDGFSWTAALLIDLLHSQSAAF